MKNAQKIPCVLVVIFHGVAEYYAAGGAVNVQVLDMDNIEAGDPPLTLPDTPEWREAADWAFPPNTRDRRRYIRLRKAKP